MLFFFFFNDTATTEIYTLSLHDALPISPSRSSRSSPLAGELTRTHSCGAQPAACERNSSATRARASGRLDRKSTRLNSSHLVISYAVFCLKKKKISTYPQHIVMPPTLNH